jgi:hypothetical protein
MFAFFDRYLDRLFTLLATGTLRTRERHGAARVDQQGQRHP